VRERPSARSKMMAFVVVENGEGDGDPSRLVE
jgi:hypothetical protein